MPVPPLIQSTQIRISTITENVGVPVHNLLQLLRSNSIVVALRLLPPQPQPRYQAQQKSSHVATGSGQLVVAVANCTFACTIRYADEPPEQVGY